MKSIQKKTSKKIPKNVVKASQTDEKKKLERSDASIRMKKNRIQRSEAHHRRRVQKKELQKAARKQKRLIEKKTGEKLPDTPLKDLEDEHREKVRVQKMSQAGSADISAEAVDLPKVLITTCKKPIRAVNLFMRDLRKLIPNAKFYKRRDYSLVDICVYANSEKFTHVVAVTQSHGKVVGMTVTSLQQGITAHFRLSSLILCHDVPNHGEWTKHFPELFFKNFEANIGERAKKTLESLFPTARDYRGRAMVTFLNKRDFIFVRAHRYIFDGMSDVSIQELGPRFTLKLQKLTQRSFSADVPKEDAPNVIWALQKEKSKRDLVI